MATVLELANISKKIGSATIIDDVSFSLEKGHVVGLLGPNGAGKTTIMKMIVGLMSTSSGNIQISGHAVQTEFKAAIAQVGAIIENPEFYNYMTAKDNLAQYARMSRRDITDDELNHLLMQVHLENNSNQKVKTYSLGMRQRLGIAQALIHKPQLLILDEPMNGLDPMGMKEFRDMMKSLKAEGVTILISSHQLADIEQICDHLIIVQKGKITHTGAVKVEDDKLQVMYLKTDNNKQAEQVLQQLQLTYHEQEQYLVIEFHKDTRSELMKALVFANVGVKEFNLHVDSLEDNFMRWTEGGGL